MTSFRIVARPVLGGLVLVFAFTALYVTAFHSPRPRGLDVGVVGSPQEATRVQRALDQRASGAFDVRRYDGERQARTALLDTDVRGVVAGHRILVARAFGVVPTQTVAQALAGATGAPVQVQDLRPLPPGDRNGLAALFTIVGTLIPSLVFGALLSVLGRRLPARARWSAVVAYSLLAGVVVAFNADVLIGALDGHFAGIALATGLLALAVSATAHGLGHLGGPVGVVLAILALLLLGLSSSGGAVTYEFEPGFYRAVSQLLPPGVALTALRNIAYFDWAATLVPLLVLCAWATAGLLLGALGERFGPHVRST
jgi:hypothetical protein